MTIQLISRPSKLAIEQAERAESYLKTLYPEETFSLITTHTHGDRDQSTPLYQMPNGIFVKDIENQLLLGNGDIAVHSLKDVSSHLDPRFLLCDAIALEDKRDVLISKQGQTLEQLPQGAKIATSSLRRRACLKRLRPDLQFVDLRGNIDTRLRLLEEGDFDAIVLAAAGLIRLGKEKYITQYFSFEEVVPACGQGALGLEIRAEDRERFSALFDTQDPLTKACKVEREFLSFSSYGCHAPIACACTIEKQNVTLDAMLGETIDTCQWIHWQDSLDTIDTLAQRAFQALGGQP